MQYIDDGRYTSQYAVDHCVCAYCWGTLVQIFDETEGRWMAVCSQNEAHVGYHHRAFMNSEIEKHRLTYLEVVDFYRETQFAPEFGLSPKLSGAALQNRLANNKRMLRSDDSGLF